MLTHRPVSMRGLRDETGQREIREAALYISAKALI